MGGTLLRVKYIFQHFGRDTLGSKGHNYLCISQVIKKANCYPLKSIHFTCTFGKEASLKPFISLVLISLRMQTKKKKSQDFSLTKLYHPMTINIHH